MTHRTAECTARGSPSPRTPPAAAEPAAGGPTPAEAAARPAIATAAAAAGVHLDAGLGGKRLVHHPDRPVDVIDQHPGGEVHRPGRLIPVGGLAIEVLERLAPPLRQAEDDGV